MLVEELLKKTDPREFLRSALKIQKSGKSNMSVAKFSRHCGFTSRSFLSEYLSGKKKLSKDSLRAISRALELPKVGKDYFVLLVAKDQPELKLYSQEKLLSETTRLQGLSVNEFDLVKKKPASIAKVVSKKKCFLVYASLGSSEKGASLAEIQRKSRLSEIEILRNLETLSVAGLITEKGDRYFAKEATSDFLNFDGEELGSLLKEIGTEMIRTPADFINDSENTVVYSAFSIDPRRVAKFKERLMEAVYSVMDEFQSETGEAVQQVFIYSKK